MDNGSTNFSNPKELEFRKLVVEDFCQPTLYVEVIEEEDNSFADNIIVKGIFPKYIDVLWKDHDPTELTNIKVEGVRRSHFSKNEVVGLSTIDTTHFI